MNYNQNIVAVIWTFNPNIERFLKVLRSVQAQVNQVVAVDNGSNNIKEIRKACEGFNNIDLIELKVNLGVHALNIGIRYATEKFNPEFILLLDDDTITYQNAIAKILQKVRESNLYEIIGAILMSSSDQGRKLIVFTRGWFLSGCLIKTKLINKGLKIRSEFFLDQADLDFYERIRELGFITVIYGEKLIEHKLGVQLNTSRGKLPFVRIQNLYEPPFRYYYLVRNSTVLLMENRLDVVFYMFQIIRFFLPLLFVDGLCKTLKALGLGLVHGIFRKLGYLDPYNAGLLSTINRLS